MNNKKTYEVAKLGYDYGTLNSTTLFADSRKKAKEEALKFLKCEKKDLKCRVFNRN